jgi:hypothetical protein
LDKYRDLSIANGGSNFLDETNIYARRSFLQLQNEFVDLLVGGNVRQYQLRSNGTLFSDLKPTKMGFSETEQFRLMNLVLFAQAEKPSIT